LKGSLLKPRAGASHLALLPLGALALGAGCASTGGSVDTAEMVASRPNIVLVFSDDHAPAAIGAYDHITGSHLAGIERSPNLDRLAAEGVLFEEMFCGNSICCPSRATLLTGAHSHVNGVLHNGLGLDPELDNFPKRLQAAGYKTSYFGKWHLKQDPAGFDHWERLEGQGPYYNPPMKSPGGVRKLEGYTTTLITDLALDWLDEQTESDSDEPFLMIVGHKAPHRRWHPEPAEFDTYEDVVFPEPATLFDNGEGRASVFHTQTMTLASDFYPEDVKLKGPGNLTPEQQTLWDAEYGVVATEIEGLEGDDLTRYHYQRYLEDYLACCHSLDREVGRLMDALDERGLSENTIFLYSSDQGFYLGEHGWYDKRWMYEPSLRMPLIARWPGHIAPGTRVDGMAQNIDLAATFCELAGAENPELNQGTSLVPLLDGEAPDDWRGDIYYRYYGKGAHTVAPHVGVRNRAGQKLMWFHDTDEWELYDLESDPQEVHNRIEDPAFAEVSGELLQRLKELAAAFGDELPPGL
jgi:arylsulfatase A-like enzyme